MQTRMPRLLLLLAATLVACEAAPEDPLFAFGSLEAPDGTPVAGTLQVLRGDCIGFWCGPSMPGPGAGEAPSTEPEFVPFTAFATEADGTWMLELTRFDATLYTQHGTLARSFKIVAQPDPTLPPVEAVYTYQGSDVDLPPLRQWDARASLALNSSGDAWEISSAAAPPIPKQEMTRLNESLPVEPHRSGTYGVAFLNADAEAIWLFPAGETGTLPLEALEDFAVAWKVLATHSGPWFAPTLLGGQTHSVITQNFPSVELPAHTPRVARSRGQSCTTLGANLAPDEELAPCPFTDGSLGFVQLDGYPSGLQLTLDSPTPLSRVVLHDVGSGQGLRIEAFDGTDWSRVHEAPAPPAPPGAPSDGFRMIGYTLVADIPSSLGPVHAVRIVPAGEGGDGVPRNGFFISGAREISLF